MKDIPRRISTLCDERREMLASLHFLRRFQGSAVSASHRNFKSSTTPLSEYMNTVMPNLLLSAAGRCSTTALTIPIHFAARRSHLLVQ